MAPHVVNDKAKEYLTEYNYISGSSESSLVIPLLRYFISEYLLKHQIIDIRLEIGVRTFSI